MSKLMISPLKRELDVIGRFQLKVRVEPKKFHLTNITGYIPKGKSAKEFQHFMSESGPVKEILIHKFITTLSPDEKEIDRHNVNVLINHPNVDISSIVGPEGYQELVTKGFKRGNAKFELINIDKVELDDFHREAELIQARAVLYSRQDPLSLERLKFLCSKFGIPYKTQITDDARLKATMIKKIDKFIQGSSFEPGKKNVDLFIEALQNIGNVEIEYYIKELIEIGIIANFGGIWKIDVRPIGTSISDIVNYYKENTDIFKEHKKIVFEKLRAEKNV